MSKIKVDIITPKTNPYYKQKLDEANKSFKWSQSQLEQIDKILEKYPNTNKGKQSAMLPLLSFAQDEFVGWLPDNVLKLVADILDISLLKVQEVASFYHMFNLKPVGKYHLQVCTNCSCLLNGSDQILQTLKAEIGELTDNISADGLFTISQVECLGDCTNSPVMQINKDYKSNLTVAKVKEIIKELKLK